MLRRSEKEAEFAAFYRSEYSHVFRAVYGYCGHREIAMDATQQAFERALVRWSRLRKQPWAGGWVMTTALNCCKRHLRKESREASTASVAVAESATTGDWQEIELVDALRTLSPRRRQAILLFYFGDLPIPAISESMGISEGAVRAHLAQGREILRKGYFRTERERRARQRPGR